MNFTINRWVRGNDFYGREALLETILGSNAKTRWVLGNRRVGKTSLLRETEWRCRQREWQPGYALYWDLQGAASSEGLKDAFLEALEDAEEVTEALGLDVDELDAYSFFEIVNKFRRKVKSGDRPVWLLIDECEELVDIAKAESNVAASFRKLSQTKGLNVILAGSHRLMDLDESQARTSPFLPDFLPPLLLEPFRRETTMQLLTDRGLDETAANEIENLTFGNPHLVQVSGEHWSRLQSRDKVMAELHRTKVCHYYFQSNFQCLPEQLRSCLKEGKARKTLEMMAPSDPLFSHVRQAALLRENQQGHLEISPLLDMVESGLTTDHEAARPPIVPLVNSSAKASPEIKKGPDTVSLLVEAIASLPRIPSVLPPGTVKADSFDKLAEASLPPSLELMASLQEPAEKVMAVLDGATPEYVLGQASDERTAVYLLGLHIFQKLYGHAAFQDCDDPWERAGAIADRDVPLPREAKPSSGLPEKAPMILARCLRASPTNRYASIKDFLQDWTST